MVYYCSRLMLQVLQIEHGPSTVNRVWFADAVLDHGIPAHSPQFDSLSCPHVMMLSIKTLSFVEAQKWHGPFSEHFHQSMGMIQHFSVIDFIFRHHPLAYNYNLLSFLSKIIFLQVNHRTSHVPCLPWLSQFTSVSLLRMGDVLDLSHSISPFHINQQHLYKITHDILRRYIYIYIIYNIYI